MSFCAVRSMTQSPIAYGQNAVKEFSSDTSFEPAFTTPSLRQRFIFFGMDKCPSRSSFRPAGFVFIVLRKAVGKIFRTTDIPITFFAFDNIDCDHNPTRKTNGIIADAALQ